MAEAFGTVVAAIEFSKALLEFKEICSSIRHAPEELTELIEELNLTDDILQTLADQDRFLSIHAPPAIVQKCRDSCKKAIEILNPICIQLSKSVQRSRWQGSLKTVLKDGLLEKAKRRIERAKINLLLAQTASSSAMSALNLQEHASTRAFLASALTVAAPLHSGGQDSGLSTRDTMRSTSTSMTYFHTQSNSETVAYVDRRPARRRVRQNTTTLLVLQNLWLGKRFEIIRERSPGISTFTIRTYNILPVDMPAFRLAGQGDVAGMQALFQAKEATIFDRDVDGDTLLHVASEQNHVPMMIFLVEQGCDANETNFEGMTCFQEVCWGFDGRKVESLQALAGSCGWELTLDEKLESVRMVQRLQPQLLADFIPMLSPPWCTFDLATRLEVAYRHCTYNGTLDAFWILLAQRQLDASSLTRTVNAGEDAHDSLVRNLARALSVDCLDLRGWRSLLRSAVKLDGFGVSFEMRCDSPMLTYLGAYNGTFYGSLSDLNNQRLSCKLRNWAREVHRAGEDLQRYGRWEEDLLDDGKAGFEMAWHRHMTCRFLKFIYGPSPEDWQIWASTSLDEHVGEFWEGVHHAEAVSAILGSWPLTGSSSSDRIHVLAIPGSWPVTESSSSHWVNEDTIDYFSASRRRRQRYLRYLGFERRELEAVLEYFDWYHEPVVEMQKGGKARRKQFYSENGITPPYRELVS